MCGGEGIEARKIVGRPVVEEEEKEGRVAEETQGSTTKDTQSS